MPLRCLSCNRLSATDKLEDCTTKTKCDFHRVEVIHFLHKDGKGKLLASRQVKNPEDASKAVTELLKLCCNSKAEIPTATAVHCAVTCLDCLEAFPGQDEDISLSEGNMNASN